MTTWDQARQIVDRALRAAWSADFPALTFHVTEWGYADDQAFQVPYGAREWLVEGDVAGCIVGDLTALVDRQTGNLSLWPTCDGGFLDRLSTMEPVGSGHPPD